MKKEILLLALLLVFISKITLLAQPANDNVCDALEILLDSTAITVMNVGATIEVGEESITPPGSVDCEGYTWCDGNDGIPLINHSLWFKFVAPITTTVRIDICESTFDTQLALYEVGDCGDWSTFNLLLANDNQTGCGIDEGLASSLWIQCLNAGQEYYLLVDDWRDSTNTNEVDLGNVEIFLETLQPPSTGILTCNPTIGNPICIGGNEGFIQPFLINEIHPLTVLWSNGATTLDIFNLTAGIYTVTVTDFCGSTLVSSFELEDPTEVTDVTLGSFPLEVVHPTHCGNGMRGGQINPIVTSGIPPYKYLWSTGDTTALLTNLQDGSYFLTVTDKCGIITTQRTYHLGATAGIDEIYPDPIEDDCEVKIGVDNATAGGDITSLTYSLDQSTESGIACRGGFYIARSATWRSFDLANDFGINGEINLHGVEVFVSSQPNYFESSGVHVMFSAYIASTVELDDPNLQLTPIDSIETYITEINDYTPFIIPLKGDQLSANDILAIKVETLDGSGDQHRFDFAANLTPTTQTTYITSTDCGIATPVKLSDLGFEHEIIMNLLLANSTGLSYKWGDPVDDPTNPTPIVRNTSPYTYTVTITDDACGTTYTDEVKVICYLDSNKEIVDQVFSIFPNPSHGEFYLTEKGINQFINVQVYDLQGKLVYENSMNLGNGDSVPLNLSGFVKGVYFAKIAHEDTIETHKLVIQ